MDVLTWNVIVPPTGITEVPLEEERKVFVRLVADALRGNAMMSATLARVLASTVISQFPIGFPASVAGPGETTIPSTRRSLTPRSPPVGRGTSRLIMTPEK
jgi:hypothetical protein